LAINPALCRDYATSFNPSRRWKVNGKTGCCGKAFYDASAVNGLTFPPLEG